MIKHSYRYIKSYFEEQECVLLDKEYNNGGEKLNYICSCGNKSRISFYSFKQGHRCLNCRVGRKIKYSYEYVNTYFEEQRCVLLSKTYQNCIKKLNYICSCGNKSRISFSDFENGVRCGCGYSEQANRKKITLNSLRNYFNREKCILISNVYVDNKTNLEYICVCGKKSFTTFNRFKKGIKCKNCGNEKREKTNLIKYGVSHVSQNGTILDKQQKSAYRYKEVITPSGKTIYLQGYEPRAYTKLLEQYGEEDIKHMKSDVPEIWYIGKDEKKHRYFPDFFIIKDNLIVEVKSEWTYYGKKWYENNQLKKQACLDSGYNFKFMVL